MRSLYWVPLLACATAGLIGLPSASDPLAQDGVTARITGWGFANAVFTPDINGDYTFNIEIFQNVGGVWQQVAVDASLHIDAPGVPEWEEKVNMAFTSLPAGALTLKVPGSAVKSGDVSLFDLYVVADGVAGVPESHHSLAKNGLIGQQKFDQADALDNEGTHYALA